MENLRSVLIRKYSKIIKFICFSYKAEIIISAKCVRACDYMRVFKNLYKKSYTTYGRKVREEIYFRETPSNLAYTGELAAASLTPVRANKSTWRGAHTRLRYA